MGQNHKDAANRRWADPKTRENTIKGMVIQRATETPEQKAARAGKGTKRSVKGCKNIGDGKRGKCLSPTHKENIRNSVNKAKGNN